MAAAKPDMLVVFNEAIARGTAQERESYLDQVYADDPNSRRKIDQLISAHFAAGKFLAGGQPTLEYPEIDLINSQIGPYKLRELIGEGGFGVVYVAEQEKPVARKVALKIIKPGMDSREIIARFEAERQALALMDHPNIARVLDAGATNEVGNVAGSLREPDGPGPASGTGSAPTTFGRPYFVMELVRGVSITEYCDQHKLPTGDRLQLFVDVCRGVQHAHQKGIIHRDLKPSNVMVTQSDGRPVPKVIDFGVAKALSQKLTDNTVYTAYGQMLGTPLYMSPEQAELSMHDVDTRSDVYSLGVLLYELLTGTTPFDKETLQKSGFDEMRRIIREVDPPRPSNRISTLGAELLSTISDNRSVDPRKLQQSLRTELDWIVMKALEKDRNRRYESASAFAADMERYLSDEPVQARPPSAAYRFRKYLRRNKKVLAVAAMFLLMLVSMGAIIGWTLRDQTARQHLAQQQIAGILQEADDWRQQERWAQAMASIQRAKELSIGTHMDSGLRRRVDEAYRDVAMVLRLEDIAYDLYSLKATLGFDFETPDAAYAAAFQEYGIDIEGLPQEDVVRLIRLRNIRLQLAFALDAWAVTRRYSGAERDRQMKTSKELLAIAAAVDPEPWRCRVRDALGDRSRDALVDAANEIPLGETAPVTLGLLGRALNDVYAADEGESLFRRAQRRHPDSFWLNYDLAQSLLRQDPPQPEEAARYLSAALALRPNSYAALYWLSRAAVQAGKREEAAALMDQLAESTPGSAKDWRNLGYLHTELHHNSEATRCYRKAIELDPNDFWAQYGLGLELLLQQQFDEAVACYKRALEIDPKFVAAHLNLGVALSKQGKLAEAVEYLRKAIELDPNSAVVHTRLGNALRRTGQHGEALACFRSGAVLDPDDAAVHNNLAWLLVTCPDETLRDPAEAVETASRAVELAPDNGTYWNTLGVARYRTGSWSDALMALEKSMDLRDGGDSLDWFFLAMAHWQLGDQDDARKWYDQAVQWMELNQPENEELRRFRQEADELLAKREQ